MRFLLLVLIAVVFITVPLRSQAQVQLSFGQNVRWQNEASGKPLMHDNLYSLRAGYDIQRFRIYVEYSQSRKVDQLSIMSVELEHHEALLWTRYLLIPNSIVAPYGAMGLGAYQQSVRTSFYAQESRVQGEARLLGGFAAGFNFAIWQGIEAQLEGKLIAGSGIDPQPTPSIGAFLGYRF